MSYVFYVLNFIVLLLLTSCGMKVKVDPKPLHIVHEGNATITVKLDQALFQAFVDQCEAQYVDPSEVNTCITENIADFFSGLNNQNNG